MVIFKAEETNTVYFFQPLFEQRIKKERKRYVFSLVSLKYQVYFVTAGIF